jgi:hypothetical protein
MRGNKRQCKATVIIWTVITITLAQSCKPLSDEKKYIHSFFKILIFL